MNTKFKLETIVPDEFYIEREADEKLKKIIDDMGRPASILVSRQMGKTNLLLHTKEAYEDKNNMFVYIDLSIADNDIRNCFRLIVDTAITTNLDIFENAEVEINKIREKGYAPQREHERELLILLKDFKGKIIICLDEIDSMINFDFSDQFFSQIRSTYFSGRTNYKEFKNLTYILSGVLEPSEIIQDSRKSPFNISEKVYLNDFTETEYKNFVKKTNLEFLSEEYIDYIYEWTSGHPRIIWDVLLKLRSNYESKKDISKSEIDEIIQFLYLEHSDIPPIDHIRTLVKKDINIAKILLELKDGIDINISNEMKNKLYLYGLINYSKSKKVKIKNKIINEVLNKDFLNEILYSFQTPILRGAEYSQQGEFRKAITEYLRALKEKNISSEETKIANFSIGMCFYHLKDYQKSLNYLNISEIDKVTNLQVFLEKEHFKGLCYLNLNNKNKSLEVFENILNFDSIKHKINTNINIASVYLKNYNSNEKNLIKKYLDEAMKLSKEQIEKDYTQLSHLHMNKASLAEQNKDYNLAISEYKTILSFDNIQGYKVNILLKLLRIDEENKNEHLDSIHKIVMSFSEELEEINDPMIFSDLSIAQIVYEYIKEEKAEMLREFLNHSVKYYDKFDSKCSIMGLSVNLLYEYINSDVLLMLTYTIENYEETEINSSECYLSIYHMFMIVSFKYNNIELIKKYIKNYIKILEKKHIVEQTNIILLVNIINMLINENDSIFALEIYNLTEKLSLRIPKELDILKVSLYDKNFELQDTFEKKIRISYKVLKVLEKNNKNIDLLEGKPHDIFNRIKMKHDLYILNNKNQFTISRKESCPCGSGRNFKDCCRKT